MRSPGEDVKNLRPAEVRVMANVYAKVRVVQTAVACWTVALLPIGINRTRAEEQTAFAQVTWPVLDEERALAAIYRCLFLQREVWE
jgi:hypothetical protein